MDSLNLVERLLADIETAPLSKSLPSLLSVALECKDYHGYCVLSYLVSPISDNPKTNTIQATELSKILKLHGLQKEDISNILQESREKVIELKTISPNQISSHSIKEMEDWRLEAKTLLESSTGTSGNSYQNLSKNHAQISRLYETLRGYIVSKLTYFQQVLKLMSDKQGVKYETLQAPQKLNTEKIFIVHGHNGEIKEALARLIERQGIQAIILHEQANQGNTIIEKFERNSDVGCAVCLFTADDTGCAKSASIQNMRARQNVVFEAGYFIGKIGRSRVILLSEKDVEIPSDLQGVLYTSSADWRLGVLKELKALGYNIDFEKI